MSLYNIEIKFEMFKVMSSMIDYLRKVNMIREMDNYQWSGVDAHTIRFTLGRQTGHTETIIQLVNHYRNLNPCIITLNSRNVNEILRRLHNHELTDDKITVYNASSIMARGSKLFGRGERKRHRLFFIDISSAMEPRLYNYIESSILDTVRRENIKDYIIFEVS